MFIVSISTLVCQIMVRPLMSKQSFHTPNTMIHGSEIIDYSIVPNSLSQYDEVIGGDFDE